MGVLGRGSSFGGPRACSTGTTAAALVIRASWLLCDLLEEATAALCLAAGKFKGDCLFSPSLFFPFAAAAADGAAADFSAVFFAETETTCACHCLTLSLTCSAFEE